MAHIIQKTSPLIPFIKRISVPKLGFALFSSISVVYDWNKWIPQNFQPNTYCCGIFGYIGNDDALPILTEGITILQNRGYDSCGISTLNENGEIITTKFSSSDDSQDCVQKLFANILTKHSNHHIGIAHTRWATHGKKTDLNAHPHHDYKNRISLIHNGIIDNYAKLKSFLISKGIPFKSETDTEVIANMIGQYLDNSHTLESAVKNTLQSLEGTWGLCILPNWGERKFIVATHGSPIVVGKSNDRVYISSEPSGLSLFLKEFVALNDGCIFEITQKGIDNLLYDCTTYKIDNFTISKDPSPFPHWTLKEIFEQPESLRRSQNYGGRLGNSYNEIKLGGLENEQEILKKLNSIALVGCGTSLHAAMFAQYFFNQLEIFESVINCDSCEFEPSSLPKTNNLGMILISQSGETLDTVQVYKNSKNHVSKHMSIVNVVGSQLARLTGCGVYLNAGYECAVASTKSFTSQISVLCMMGLWFFNHSSESKIRSKAYEKPNYKEHTIQFHSASLNAHDSIKPPSSFSLTKLPNAPLIHNANILEDNVKDYSNSFLNFNGNSFKHEKNDESTSQHPQNTENDCNHIYDNKVPSNATNLMLKSRENPDRSFFISDKNVFAEKLHTALKNLPDNTQNLLESDIPEKCQNIASKLINFETVFILGTGACYPIALEGALKMKEMAYIHAEGFSGSALKHGPFAMIDPNKHTPIILLVQNDSRLNKMHCSIQQVKARGSFVICIHTKNTPLEMDLIDESIAIDSDDILAPMLFNITLQLISYYAALAKEINPDKPRGLAKTVTVQ